MTIYRCEKCFKTFRQKCHLDDHLTKRLKPCSPSSILNLLKSSNSSETLTNSSQIPQNLLTNSAKNIIDIKSIKSPMM